MENIKSFVKKNEEIQCRDLAHERELKKKVLKSKKSMISLQVFIVCTLMLLSIFSPTAFAEEDDSDDDGFDDEIEEYNKRGIHIDFEPYEIELKSLLLSENTHHEIEIELDSSEKIKVSMEFSTSNNTPEPEIEISVEFREIIEFEDRNDNGFYDSADEEVSVYDLREADYREIEYSTDTTQDGETEHILIAQTTDNVFKVVVHAVGNFAKIESGTISPSEIKIDLIIQNYPYMEEDTKLAISAKLESEEEMRDGQEGNDDEGKVIISAVDAEAYFSWASTADVDGVETPVRTSTETEEDGDLKIYFAYERGTEIDHDPKLGVPFLTVSSVTQDSNDDSSPRVAAYIAAMLVGGLAIGGAVYIRRKKNGYR
jgi:hypothetical protein